MYKRHKTFAFLYALILILNIYALVTQNQLLRMIAMPLIGTSLILYLLIKTKIEEQFHRLIFMGLVLSLAGDIQLLFTTGTEFYFLTGLIATLIGYTLYSYAYFIDFTSDLSKTRTVGNVLLMVLLIVTVSFFIAAGKSLREFTYPAIAYFLILSAMMVLSGYRHKRVNRLSFKLIFTGSFSFVISNLSIGYYNFIDAEHTMMIIFLFTYLIAQYLVVMGSIERKLFKNSK
ncbi:MAG: lysoplasmalogenase [Sphingobacteriaceae bacterium]|nr:lysoplasmalogenase [Sphingobacteriaceae bacterium]